MITIPFQCAYFALTVPFVIAWLLTFVFSKRTRKEQLFMSFLFLPAGPLSELLYFQDYWNPASILSLNIGPMRFLLEDFLFIFSVVGVGAVIYEFLSRRKLLKTERKDNKILAFSLVIVIATVVSLSLFFLGLNSIFATSLGFVVAALFIISQRKDLFINSLVSGLAVTFLMFISYFILTVLINNTEELLKQGWYLYGTSLDFRVLGIPFTEMIWGFTFGMLVGPLYKFIKGLKSVRNV